jgi:hypothetical protein
MVWVSCRRRERRCAKNMDYVWRQAD